MGERFANDFRRFFLRGLGAVLPPLLTVAIIIYIYRFVQDSLGQHINHGVIYLAARIWAFRTYQVADGDFHAFLDRTYNGILEAWNDYYFWWVGFVLAIVAIYIFGRFVASFFGRTIWRMVEATLHRMPVIRQIYPHVKQVTDFFFSEKKLELSRVVAVEYPRKGIWSLGLVTSPGLRTLQQALGGELLTVFVPSSPTPVTGYTITVRRDEVIDLPVSIDEALRFTVSGGVVVPFGQQLGPREIEKAQQGILPARASKEASA